ncbi:MAG: type II toxin-antitoxin system RelE/ParE family toxin [Microcoleaceae cyanobacterium]
MPQIVWTESPVEDLNRHYEFLKINNADAAAKAVKGIVSSAEILQENPRRGSIVDGRAGLRKLLVFVCKSGYVIHYTIFEDDVVILRVYRGRENRTR